MQRTQFGALVLFYVCLTGTAFYSVNASAQISTVETHGVQLAYFIGYHTGSGVYYRAPGIRHERHRYYWTGWRYTGHGCKKNCLVDRWRRHIVRCNRRC